MMQKVVQIGAQKVNYIVMKTKKQKRDEKGEGGIQNTMAGNSNTFRKCLWRDRGRKVQTA